MKLSIVIPVYQVAKTLPRCLDSIINQSFRDWQAILVDDGSTDGSSKLCDDYVKRDRRIQVVHHRKNMGLSAARNTGLDKVRGQYITFVDSDDYLADETLKTLFEMLNIHPDYDMLEYPVYEHFGSNDRNLLQFPKREYTDMLEYWLDAKAYEHTYAWNKIYRKEVFDKIKFPVRRNFEDAYVLPRVLRNCKLVATTDCGLYYYCFNENGITYTAKAKELSHLLEAHTRTLANILKIPNILESNNKYFKLLGQYYAAIINIQLDVFRAGGRISKYVPKLPFSHTFKLKVLQLIGLKRLCQLHKLIIPRRSSRS